jgi:hypothetical protein
MNEPVNRREFLAASAAIVSSVAVAEEPHGDGLEHSGYEFVPGGVIGFAYFPAFACVNVADYLDLHELA